MALECTVSHCVFSLETAFGGGRRDGAGSCKNFLGRKKKFFLVRTPWRGIRMTFSLLWRGIGTFWFILVRNLYILARICTFWRDEAGPGKEKF